MQLETLTGGSSRLQCLEAIKAALDEFHFHVSERLDGVMEIEVLLSANRGTIYPKESGLLQVGGTLGAKSNFNDLVVGLDVFEHLSKPSVVPHLIPAMLERKHACRRLPVTPHIAGIKDADGGSAILNSTSELNIRRVGHCFSPPDV